LLILLDQLKNNLSKLSSIIREACVESVEEAGHAEAHGAQQIELCSQLDLDGLTPSRALIQKVRKACSIQIKVMIRPRAGDFVYNNSDLKKMQDDILWCKKQGITEVVMGLLNAQHEIDIRALSKLAAVAYPMEITFHKAFDLIKDPEQGLALLKTIPNVKFILSSGLSTTAWEGREVLKKMVQIGGDRIQIIVAGKVRPAIIERLHNYIGASYYHGRGIV